jgi:hypothetical protein
MINTRLHEFDSGELQPPQSGLTLVYCVLQGMSVGPNGDRNNSLIRGFIGSVNLANRRGYCIRDGGAVFVGHPWCGALVLLACDGIDCRFTLLPLPLFLP